MEHARFVVIDPNDRMVVMDRHEIQSPGPDPDASKAARQDAAAGASTIV
jgi:hypothetical protein